MNSWCKRVVVLCVLGQAALPSAARAEPGAGGAAAVQASGKGAVVRELSEAEVVELSIRNNPDVAGAVLAERQAGLVVRSEEGRYPYILAANAGYTHSALPTLSRDGSVVTGTRDSFAVGSELRRVFPTGTNVSVRVQGERSTTNRSDGALVTSGAAGTGYTVSTRLTVAQPLLRGAWTTIGEATLRTAKIDQRASQEGLERVTSEVIRDALLGYWELWYAGQSTRIERAAREFAATQRDEAAKRSAGGALSPADVLAFETRVASLDESVTTAELTELQRTLDLALLLGIAPPSGTWRANGAPPEQTTVPGVKEIEAKLARQSPELAELKAKVDAAEARAAVAGDAYRPRLDVEGYVETRGLGNGNLSGALSQYGSFSAVSGYVGVVFETPLTGGRETAEIDAARLGARIARNQFEAAQRRIQLAAARLVSQFEAAKVRRAAAEQTVSIAERQLEAERARFSLGASTPIQVQEAEDALRRARLRVARARVDEVEAWISLQHAVGDLVTRYVGSGAK